MSAAIAALTGRGNFFEDFNAGDVYEHARGKTMEMLENVLITNLVLNTAQVHFNEDAVQRLGGQPHRIVFGGVTASLVIGLAMQDTGEQAVEEIGLDKVRFRVPVMHGDTLYAFTEVLAKNDSAEVTRGHKEAGEIHFKHYGVNQRGETVFEGERKVLIKKRAFTTAGLGYVEAEEAVVVVASAPERTMVRKLTPGGLPKKIVAKSVKTKPAKPAKTAKAKKIKAKVVKKIAKLARKAVRPKKR
ncbi:MAG: MaoC family dehydratase [Candidatus Binataceae bacterium]|jgi:acyl dehydratase